MPFNRATMFAGPRTFILTSITAEDLDFSYDVEGQVVSQFGISGTRAGDNVILSVGAVKLVTGTVLGLDGSSLHDNAIFTLNIVSGTKILGGGGNGGVGGFAVFDPEPPNIGNAAGAGTNGGIGHTPIRLGCTTFIKGAAGNIELGYGGGGGGGGDWGPSAGGGGGGGGGAPLGTNRGLGGAGGNAEGGSGSVNGTAGGNATETVKGAGGAGGNDGGAGGNGAQVGVAAQAGGSGNAAGGSAGSDGGAISKQGFDLTVDGGITVIGAVS